MKMMIIKNQIGKEVSLNEKELNFLKYLSRQDEYDNGRMIGIPDIDVDGFSESQVYGYMSDLDKKSLIQILEGKEYSFGCDSIHISDKIITQIVSGDLGCG